MSLITEYVIPGVHGKIFVTNAEKKEDLEKIKSSLLALIGIKEVEINLNSFPREISVISSELVSITDIQKSVLENDFHLIPKSNFSI